nr:unnamed protein product [Spirometra erinaceieuropaei]
MQIDDKSAKSKNTERRFRQVWTYTGVLPNRCRVMSELCLSWFVPNWALTLPPILRRRPSEIPPPMGEATGLEKSSGKFAAKEGGSGPSLTVRLSVQPAFVRKLVSDTFSSGMDMRRSEPWEAGVALAIRNDVVKPPSCLTQTVNDRLRTMRLPLSANKFAFNVL